MDIGILVRGQSNAGYFMYYEAAEKVRLEVQQDLGFDGLTDRVILLGAFGKTVVSGSRLLCPKDRCPVAERPWMLNSSELGWTAGELETNFLHYAEEQHRTTPVPVVLTLWMHNESDVYDRRVTASEWAGAVRADARLARAAFQLAPDHSPYMFVWIPAASSPMVTRFKGVSESAEQIKAGMAMLGRDCDFHAMNGPQTGDVDMSNGSPGDGYLHMTTADASSLVHRISNCVADALQPYAKPGSIVARDPVDCHGPVAEHAMRSRIQAGSVTVVIRRHPATTIQPLGSAASMGAGWVAVSPDQTETSKAKSARVVSDSEVEVSFPKPLTKGWRIYYGYGVGRISYEGGRGQGSALYDSLGIPMTIPSAGLTLEGLGATASRP